jgi:hypothetical protein
MVEQPSAVTSDSAAGSVSYRAACAAELVKRATAYAMQAHRAEAMNLASKIRDVAKKTKWMAYFGILIGHIFLYSSLGGRSQDANFLIASKQNEKDVV